MLNAAQRRMVERAAKDAAEAALEDLVARTPDPEPDTLHQHIYMVEGTGPFPLDMLRYDASHPHTERDAMRAMREDQDEPRRVGLEHLGRSREWKPTRDRWESFGWKVVAVM